MTVFLKDQLQFSNLCLFFSGTQNWLGGNLVVKPLDTNFKIVCECELDFEVNERKQLSTYLFLFLSQE